MTGSAGVSRSWTHWLCLAALLLAYGGLAVAWTLDPIVEEPDRLQVDPWFPATLATSGVPAVIAISLARNKRGGQGFPLLIALLAIPPLLAAILVLSGLAVVLLA